MTIELGTKAPDFTLTNQAGEDVSLSDFKGKNVIIYFYPKDLTPGCTIEACDFRDNYDFFEGHNTTILGISPDPVESHEKFIEKYSLQFNLLADTEHDAAELYGVWKKKKMFDKEYYGIERSTFVIDKEGYVRKIDRKVKVKGHVDEVFEHVKEYLA